MATVIGATCVSTCSNNYAHSLPTFLRVFLSVEKIRVLETRPKPKLLSLEHYSHDQCSNSKLGKSFLFPKLNCLTNCHPKQFSETYYIHSLNSQFWPLVFFEQNLLITFPTTQARRKRKIQYDTPNTSIVKITGLKNWSSFLTFNPYSPFPQNFIKKNLTPPPLPWQFLYITHIILITLPENLATANKKIIIYISPKFMKKKNPEED